ncbi:MAG: hypothetical protein IKL06_00825 [Lachnospiraceae bacterium]|nr:hypothetical protein [Lachnospiraceae bacterium]
MMNNNFNNGATNNNSNNGKGDFIMTTGTIGTMEVFAGTVKRAMEVYYGEDYRVSVQDVQKNNGLVLTGITILKKDCNIAPTIYLNQVFEQYQEGRTIESICREIIRIYEEHAIHTDFDVSYVTDFAKVQNHICYKLINAKKNETLLNDVPHVVLEDLAIIFYILVSKDLEGTGTITVKNNMLSFWDVDTDTLYKLAILNTQRLFRGTVQSMASVMTEIISHKLDEESAQEFYDMMVGEDDMIPMYICTNADKLNGAGVILYQGLLQEFADRVGSDFYILPSSIHETLLIPVNSDMDIEYLRDMVRTVKRTEVAPDEILSDSVYYYNRLRDRVEIA